MRMLSQKYECCLKSTDTTVNMIKNDQNKNENINKKFEIITSAHFD